MVFHRIVPAFQQSYDWISLPHSACIFPVTDMTLSEYLERILLALI